MKCSELVQKDWSSEALKKITDGMSPSEKENCIENYEDLLSEYYLKDTILDFVMKLSDMIIELRKLLEKDKKD